MKIGKKSIKSKGLLLLLSLVLGFVSLSLKPLQSEAYVGWPGILTENGRLPATPSEAEGSEVDFRDAFNLPGVFGGTTAQANHSYFSLERPNVVILYDGVNNDQKSMVWYTQKLSLNQPFEFESYVFLSNAAVQIGNLGVPDGMAFVMHNDPAGETAIGGTGGGLGVYPRASNLDNMIYNAVAVEFDTFANVNTEINTHYDQEFLDKGQVAWPHVAIGKTATSQDFGFGNTAIRDVMTNFKHIGPTVPASGEVADWFGVWKKVVVKWQPLPDKINGVLSYKFADYPEQSTTLDIDKTFNSTNWYNAERPIWDRKVTWGYTGSNGLKGNPFAAMITKLPQEPDVDVDRKVRNVTKGETEAEFRTSTVAHVGDILEYKVHVKNNVVEDLDISLKKTKVLESLEKNSYITDSFAFSNSLSATPVAPTVTIDGDNNFTYVDSANEYPTGTSFEYTYKVTVGANTTEFINDVALSSTYSTRTQYGETTVNVLPEELKLVKTVNDTASVNPIVDDLLTVKVALDAERGVYMMDTLKDTVPAGFDIVPNSTYIYNEGAIGPNELLADASVWSGNTLTVERAPNAWQVIGNPKNNKMIIEYKIKPTSAVKGKEVTLPTAVADGTNQYVDTKDKQDYQVMSNNATVKVKTDVIVSFKNMDSSLLEASKIISTNAAFNKKKKPCHTILQYERQL
ncbi:hypothetical protein [uncultured Enterococcus sp.]|uniref:lectin-like domain-containing protein n=1 Tax=uncultured Enterococcus sp. TaxID=167972 RepID=UPI002AA8548F|nr:hypothetical protein [uncultured Enterococcus sp.]